MAPPPVEESRPPWLVLMMKAPESGAVKTRLAAEIGAEEATRLYRGFVEYLVETVLAARERRWRPVIAYTPAGAESEIRKWLAGLLPEDSLFIDQGQGDLGKRLRGVFERGFQKFAPAIIAIGADCLDVTAHEIGVCIDALRFAPLVMGESLDGGYWVIGMRGRYLEIFDNMPWSTPHLARATRERARELLLPMIERPIRMDVDTKADLDKLRPELREAMGLEGPRSKGN